MIISRGKGLPLNGLKAFEAAARHESFSRAAAEMGVTPAAISQQVKLLEQATGLCLFERHAQSLTLTSDARELLPAVQDSFARIGSALEAANLRKSHDDVTIAVTGVFAHGWLLPRIKVFRIARPDIRVKVTTHNNRGAIPDDSHLVIRFGGGQWPGYESTQLMRTEVTPLCSPSAAQALRDFGDIEGAPLLDTAACEDCCFRPWPAWFKAAGLDVKPDPVAEFDSSALSVATAMNGCGICIAAPALFQHELASGTLRRPYELAIEHPSTFYLLRRSDQKLGRASDILWDWIYSEREVH